MNKETAINLFDRNSCLIGDRDVILEDIAEKLTSRQAVEFAYSVNKKGHNGYCVGDYTVFYMTLAKGTNKTTLTERVFNTEVEAERLQERLIELDVNFPKSVLMIPTFKDDLLKIAKMCGEELTDAEKDLGADYQDIVNMQMRAAMGLGE